MLSLVSCRFMIHACLESVSESTNAKNVGFMVEQMIQMKFNPIGGLKSAEIVLFSHNNILIILLLWCYKYVYIYIYIYLKNVYVYIDTYHVPHFDTWIGCFFCIYIHVFIYTYISNTYMYIYIYIRKKCVYIYLFIFIYTYVYVNT